jgi:hypothetical protein
MQTLGSGPLRVAAGVLIAVAVGGCASRAPKLSPPEQIQAFCAAGKVVRGKTIVSILSSVADKIAPVDVPDEAALRKHLADQGGAIGRWSSQPLYMPATSRALAVGGDYLDVRDVVVADEAPDADSRIVYVTVKLSSSTKRLALQAFDTQSACVDPRRPVDES